MKHPALTRFFSIMLVIMCAIMLINGAVGIGNAKEEEESDAFRYEALCTKINTYEELSTVLEGTVSYHDASEELAARQDEHREQASQHRTDLATYTATRGGVEMGTKALDQADAAMNEAKKQYESGVKQFAEGEKQFEAMLAVYDRDAFAAQKKACADDAAECAEIEADLRQILQMYQQASGGGEPGEGAGGEPGEGAGSPGAEESQQIPDVISTVMTYLGKLAKYQATINNSIELIRPFASMIDGGEEMLGQVGSSGGTGMDMSLIMTMPDEQKLGMLINIFSGMRTGLLGMQTALQSTEDGIAKAQETLRETQEQLALAGAQIKSGEEQLYTSRTELWAKIGELRDTKTELEEEKIVLENQAAELNEAEKETDAQKERERRHKSTRINLLSYEGISSRVDNGGELTESAKEYAEEYYKEYNHKYRMLFVINILAIVGGAAGIMGLPAAFEKTKSRIMLIGPVALCLGCAVAADCLNMSLSLGQMYTALFTAIFAAIHLLIVCTAYKKVKK